MNFDDVIDKALAKNPLHDTWLAAAREEYRAADGWIAPASKALGKRLRAAFEAERPGARPDRPYDQVWADVIDDLLYDARWTAIAETLIDEAAGLEDEAAKDKPFDVGGYDS